MQGQECFPRFPDRQVGFCNCSFGRLPLSYFPPLRGDRSQIARLTAIQQLLSLDAIIRIAKLLSRDTSWGRWAVKCFAPTIDFPIIQACLKPLTTTYQPRRLERSWGSPASVFSN